MVRVEADTSDSPAPQLPPAPSKRRWPRIKFSRIGLLLTIVVVLLVVLFIGRLGLISLPLLDEPGPRRLVSGDSTDLTSIQKQIINNKETDTAQTITLSESDLTAMLNDQFEGLAIMPILDGQLTIEPKDIELYGHLAGRPSMTITISFKVSEINDDIDITIKSLKLGHVIMPIWIIKNMINQDIIGSVPNLFADIGAQSIELRSEQIDLSWAK